ncbi:unnamed protein product [Paramecium sonneborni]|uniref:Uncharacterized protein n=1 Tax=Paramecium sonneborni TaxID=65129 RepID=A0A8S1QTL1_9CILI|nr:unnamed protein product [Paramecium sonneborni]
MNHKKPCQQKKRILIVQQKYMKDILHDKREGVKISTLCKC